MDKNKFFSKIEIDIKNIEFKISKILILVKLNKFLKKLNKKILKKVTFSNAR
jgi:hypothetical protein